MMETVTIPKEEYERLKSNSLAGRLTESKDAKPRASAKAPEPSAAQDSRNEAAITVRFYVLPSDGLSSLKETFNKASTLEKALFKFLSDVKTTDGSDNSPPEPKASTIKAETSRMAGEYLKLMAERKREQGNVKEEEELSKKARQKYESAEELFREAGKDKEAKECENKAEDCRVLSDETKKDVIEAKKEAERGETATLEELKKKYDAR